MANAAAEIVPPTLCRQSKSMFELGSVEPSETSEGASTHDFKHNCVCMGSGQTENRNGDHSCCYRTRRGFCLAPWRLYWVKKRSNFELDAPFSLLVCNEEDMQVLLRARLVESPQSIQKGEPSFPFTLVIFLLEERDLQVEENGFAVLTPVRENTLPSSFCDIA